jgi:prolyl oligopeptidase
MDNYHGTRVHDPYRWLENVASDECERWVTSQNALTDAFLARFGQRVELRRRFEELLQYQRRYELVKRGSYVVFKQSEGLSPRPNIYLQCGLGSAPSLLVDFDDLAPRSGCRAGSFALSGDTRFLAYGFGAEGGDFEEYRIKDLTTGRDLPDRVQGVASARIAWAGRGFYYCRYAISSYLPTNGTARCEQQQVWYHRVGTPQEDDTLVYWSRDHPLRLHFVFTPENERWVVLSILDAAENESGNELALLDRAAPGRNFGALVTGFESRFEPIAGLGDSLLVLTDRAARNYRLILIDPSRPQERHWMTLIHEREHPIERVRVCAGRIFVLYREGIASRICAFDETGVQRDEFAPPGIGLVSLFEGQWEDSDTLWSFEDFTTPPTIYRYNIATRCSFPVHAPQLPCDVSAYETTHTMYPSKDGTKIPLHIVHRRALSLDGSHPLLLYGYGGNATVVEPAFDPLLLALLERGVVFAAAGLRGGGEFGEAWHEAGWRDRKQTVFDDCIAAGEWLQRRGYTSSDRCALIGASNGGLLVGAVITQRPDLFRVALPCAGLFDMLRYEQFTIGWAFASEFGSSQDPALFPVLLAYSPLHNIRPGISYPATLASTSRNDDRVASVHSFKFIATLQHNASRRNPCLLRVSQGRAHGPGNLTEALDERADLYAFFLAHVT